MGQQSQLIHKAWFGTLLGLAFAALGVGEDARAQGRPATAAMREVREVPRDCRTALNRGAGPSAQSWQAFVWMEHCDRIKRLVRLSALLPPDQQPVFYEGTIPADRLPPGFGADVPVLRVVFPERTFFDTATASLRPEAEQVTAIVAESLRREPPDVAMFVAGHADSRGERVYNERLSIDRADAIARRIYAAGVASSSIWRVGFGEDMPLVSGDDDYAYDRNRRVEFLFAAKPEAVGTWLADQQVDQLCQARTSLDVARCKARLDFRDAYDAVEVRRAAPVTVRPTIRPAERIAPRPAPARRVDPGLPAQIAVEPMGERRIRIDPRARRADPVRVNL